MLVEISGMDDSNKFNRWFLYVLGAFGDINLCDQTPWFYVRIAKIDRLRQLFSTRQGSALFSRFFISTPILRVSEC